MQQGHQRNTANRDLRAAIQGAKTRAKPFESLEPIIEQVQAAADQLSAKDVEIGRNQELIEQDCCETVIIKHPPGGIKGVPVARAATATDSTAVPKR